MFFVDKKVAALLICIPLLYTMLFGGLFIQNALTDIPIVICNLDGGSYGRRIVRDLGDTPEVRVVEVNADPTDLERRMIEMKSFGVVVIPKDVVEEVIDDALKTIEKEDTVRERLQNGSSLQQAYADIGAI